MESVSWMIFGDGCVGHKCMDMAVTQSTTWRRARIPLYLSYGLGKAEYSSLADKNFRVRRSRTLSYVIRTEHSL
jgi:hypothetical protein